MNVDKIALQGTYETRDSTPARALVMPLLPNDGSYAITGTILAVEDAPTRPCVAFYPRFVGSIVAGSGTDNSAVQAMPPSSKAAAQASGTSAPQVVVTGRQLEVLLTGAAGKTVQWAWDLELVTLTLPTSPTASPGSAVGPAKPVTPIAIPGASNGTTATRGTPPSGTSTSTTTG
jgi:hypothetical protein